MTPRTTALLLAATLFATDAFAAPGGRSPDGVWTETAPGVLYSAPRFGFEAPAAPRTFRLDDHACSGLLQDAPLERSAAARTSPRVLTLPMPDGTYARFRVEESPVLADAMAAAQPGTRTYVAQGLDDPTHSARLGRTALGFHAIVVTPDDFVFVERATSGPGDLYVSFRRSDLPAPEGLECGVDPAEARALPGTPVAAALPSGATLHAFDLAIVTTGEFTSFYGTTALAQAAVAVHVNQVNAIFEREVAIRFRLVCLRTYADRVTDPFTNPDVVDGLLLSQSNETLGLTCGAGAYQVGHLFHRRTTGEGFVGRGRAQFGTVCGGLKGRAASTATRPDWPQFVVDLVPHEIAHQFNANHTYNSQAGGCVERFGSAAFEVGAGTTILSYACAGCTGEDPPGCADAYFHTHSLGEITTFRDDYAICGARTATGNTPPTVDAGPDRTIPRETPFTLAATGSDADGDALTWTWEQYDLGAASPPLNGAVTGPLFRSLPPSTSPARTFPDAAALRLGTPTPFEILPTVDRTLTFRATARDNRAGGGGVNHDTVVLSVRGAPFRVTAPNGGEALDAGSAVDVAWQVGGGSVAPAVNVLFSSDGGRTFPLVLAAGTPNDGLQSVTLPGVPTDQGRIRVEGAGHVFFDLSDADFSVRAAAPLAQVKGAGEVVIGSSGIGHLAFKGSVTAACGILARDVVVAVEVANGAATLAPEITRTQAAPDRVLLSGSVAVGGVTACPVDLRVRVEATDACGAPAATALDARVVDGIAPAVAARAQGGAMNPAGLFVLPFSASILDNAPVAPGDVVVSVTNPTGNATVGTPVFLWGETTPGAPAELTGLVAVTDVKGFPAVVRIAVDVRDGCHNAGSDVREVLVAPPVPPVVGVDDPALPTVTRLAGLRPNPFLVQTVVAFELARPAGVRLEVYSPAGARLRTLAAGAAFPAGRHAVPWDGRDEAGRRGPPGVCFVRFAADGVTAADKALRLP